MVASSALQSTCMLISLHKDEINFFSNFRMPHFYSLTLQKASSINQAVYGNFSQPKAQEIVVSRYDPKDKY